MKVVIDGYEFEGTPEEIDAYIRLFDKSGKSDISYVEVSPVVERIDSSWQNIPTCCQHCPNLGKGACLCTLPYMTQTGWRGNYTVATTTTYTADIPEKFKSTEYTTSCSQTESGCSSGCKSGCNSNCKK